MFQSFYVSSGENKKKHKNGLFMSNKVRQPITYFFHLFIFNVMNLTAPSPTDKVVSIYIDKSYVPITVLHMTPVKSKQRTLKNDWFINFYWNANNNHSFVIWYQIYSLGDGLIWAFEETMQKNHFEKTPLKMEILMMEHWKLPIYNHPCFYIEPNHALKSIVKKKKKKKKDDTSIEP